MYALRPYLSTPASRTRRRISFAGLYDVGTFVQPVAFVGAAPANGGWPAYPAGWSNWSPNDAMNGASSKIASPAWPMKFVATPRPEKNDWKSIVGPLIVALRPPAHSTCATFRPPRSAACAIDSACSTFASNAVVRLANGCPFTGNVLFVDPCTPGHAPVASEYQPAPVFGGACVSSPPPAAETPLRRNCFIVGIPPWSTYFATRSCRSPSEVKKTARGFGSAELACEPVSAAGLLAAVPTVTVSAASAPSRTASRIRANDTRQTSS